MSVPEAVRTRYRQEESALTALFRYLEPTIKDIAHHLGRSYEGRVKSLESVAEKLETSRYSRWSEIDDLVGFTIVITSSAQENAVLAALDTRFHRTSMRSRATAAKPPDVFRFDATRWYGRLRKEDPPAKLEQSAFEITFEVQIKSAFEHAWSQVTHDLVYKADDVQWNKRRLAAQLKALVEQIDVLVEHFEQTAGTMVVSRDSRVDAMYDSITMLRTLLAEGAINAALEPESWTRLAENLLEVLDRSPTGNSKDSPKTLRSISKRFCDAVRSGTFQSMISGSLFQAIVAFAALDADPTTRIDLTGVPLAASGELTDLYGFSPPTPIDLAH